MGGGNLVNQQNLVSLMPDAALCAVDRVNRVKYVNSSSRLPQPKQVQEKMLVIL